MITIKLICKHVRTYSIPSAIKFIRDRPNFYVIGNEVYCIACNDKSKIESVEDDNNA